MTTFTDASIVPSDTCGRPGFFASLTDDQKVAALKGRPKRELLADAPISQTLLQFDRVRLWERQDPLLALALYVEAVASGRIERGVFAASQMATLASEARRLVVAATKAPFQNPLYPDLERR